MEVNWRNPDNYPVAAEGWQLLHPASGRYVWGEARVRRALAYCHAFSALLVTTPGDVRFRPPLCVDAVAEGVRDRIFLQYRFLLIYVGALMLVMGAWYLSGGREQRVFNLLLTVGLLFGFLWVDHWQARRHQVFLRERSMFLVSMVLHAGKNIRVLWGLMLLLGLLQVGLQRFWLDWNGLVTRFGLVENYPWWSAPWRLLLGPLLHSGLLHWLSSLVYAALALALTAMVWRSPWKLFVFFLLLAGILFRLLPDVLRPEMMLGTSSASFALFGFCLHDAIRHKSSYPKGFWLTLCLLVSLFLSLPFLLSARTDHSMDLTGLLLGLAAGLLGHILAPRRPFTSFS